MSFSGLHPSVNEVLSSQETWGHAFKGDGGGGQGRAWAGLQRSRESWTAGLPDLDH